MKKTLLFIFLVFFTGFLGAQNLVNFTVDAGDDTTLNCETGPCTEIDADFVETYNPTATHAYNVISIPFDPVATTNPTGLSNDDTYSALIDLPFNFTFYGDTYDQVIIGGNGDIVFNPAYAGNYNAYAIASDELVPHPDLGGNALGPTAAIFGAFHDIHVGIGGSISYEVTGTAPFRAFVVNYDNIPHFSCTTIHTTQQIVLHETSNFIDVYITEKPICATFNGGLAVIGIQNAGGTIGVTPPGRNTGQWEADMEAWRFKPVADMDAANFTYNLLDQYGNVVAVEDPAQVCLDLDNETSQTYTAQVSYVDGDGNIFQVEDDVMVDFEEQDLTGSLTDELLCDGGTGVNLNATPNNTGLNSSLLSYEWRDENGNVVGSSASYMANESGVFTVDVTYGSCTETFTSNVTFGEAPNVDLGADFTSCFAANEVLDATPSNFTVAESTFEWYKDGALQAETGATFNATDVGTYSVTVTSPEGCETTSDIVISQGNNLVVDLGGNISVCENESESISIASTVTGNEDDVLTYVWTDESGAEVGTSETLTGVTQSGTYTLTVSNGICTGTGTVSVIDFCIPEGISPSGDGINDCMDLTFLSDRTGIAGVEIFNRYGTSIYQQNNYTNEWCGQTSDGEDLPTGTYYYVIKFAGADEVYGAVKTGWIYITREVN